MDAPDVVLEEREPFSVEGLEKYHMTRELTQKCLKGHALEDFRDIVRAGGRLPPGTVGDCEFYKLRGEIEHFVRKVRPYLNGKPEPVSLDLEIGPFRLTGSIEGIYRSEYIRYRNAKLTSRDRIAAWITHLGLCASGASGYPKTSRVAGTDVMCEFDPVSDSRKAMEQLLDVYWRGLVRPVHFFPDSSWVYAYSVIERKKSPLLALRSADKKWTGNEFRPWDAESADAYLDMCFEGTDPLDEEFEQLSLDVWGPLMGSRREIKG